MPILKNDLSNNDYLELIENVQKFLKINNKLYPMLIQFYNNEKNKDIVNDENINLKLEQSSKELNDKLNNIISNNMKKFKDLNNISKYTKNNIISFLQNKSFKLEALNVDNELFESNNNEIQNIINIYLKEDKNLIKNFGNINTIKNLLIKNNIRYDLKKFYNLNSLQIFNLLFDICEQFNLQIN